MHSSEKEKPKLQDYKYEVQGSKKHHIIKRVFIFLKSIKDKLLPLIMI